MKLPWYLTGEGTDASGVPVISFKWWVEPVVRLWFWLFMACPYFGGKCGMDAVLVCEECGQEVNPKYADAHHQNHRERNA